MKARKKTAVKPFGLILHHGKRVHVEDLAPIMKARNPRGKRQNPKKK